MIAESPKRAEFLCFHIGHLNKRLQFIICSTGVFFFFIVYGYFQELIFRFEEFRPFGWYLTFVQFCNYTVFSLLETRLRNDTIRKIPLRIYAFLALLTVGTMGFSNASLGHLNYPTQVIFKCCKLIPVLVGSALIQRKKYAVLDYIAAALMCIGLIFFTLADSKVSPVFDVVGLVMISTALLFDAIIGNVQEKEMKKHKASNAEVVLFSYGIGTTYILFYLLVSGEFVPAFDVCLRNVWITYGYAFLFSLTGYIGIQLVLQLVRTTGAYVSVTVTTMRKAVSIILSFLLFSKPFTSQYVYSGMLVVFGIYLNLYAKKHQDFHLSDICEKFTNKSRQIFKNSTYPKHLKSFSEECSEWMIYTVPLKGILYIHGFTQTTSVVAQVYYCQTNPGSPTIVNNNVCLVQNSKTLKDSMTLSG